MSQRVPDPDFFFEPSKAWHYFHCHDLHHELCCHAIGVASDHSWLSHVWSCREGCPERTGDIISGAGAESDEIGVLFGRKVTVNAYSG